MRGQLGKLLQLGPLAAGLHYREQRAPDPAPRCRLDDFENACAAYDKAVQLAGEPGEAIFHLNYGA